MSGSVRNSVCSPLRIQSLDALAPHQLTAADILTPLPSSRTFAGETIDRDWRRVAIPSFVDASAAILTCPICNSQFVPAKQIVHHLNEKRAKKRILPIQVPRKWSQGAFSTLPSSPPSQEAANLPPLTLSHLFPHPSIPLIVSMSIQTQFNRSGDSD